MSILSSVMGITQEVGGLDPDSLNCLDGILA